MRSLFIAAAVFASWVGSANAAIITQTGTISGSSSNGLGFFREDVIEFNRFNPEFGSLTGVSVAFHGTVAHAASFTPDPDTGCGGPNCTPRARVFWSTGFTLNGPGFPIRMPNFTEDFFVQVNVSTKGNFLSRFGVNEDPVGVIDTEVTGLDPFGYIAAFDHEEAAILDVSDYVGAGKVSLRVFVAADSNLCINLGIKPECLSQYDVDATLRYSFAAVPIADAALLLLTALGPLAVQRRRRGRTPAV